jgi:hypothetical protein
MTEPLVRLGELLVNVNQSHSVEESGTSIRETLRCRRKDR